MSISASNDNDVGDGIGLLERADHLDRRRGISRAKLVEEGLKSVLAKNRA